MRRGEASRTAVMVCKARAVASARRMAGFVDDTAAVLLPDDARRDLELHLAQARRSFSSVQLEKRAAMMVARTVAIDEAVREAGAPQVVVLGAGLDGRAWRMDALREAIVFEVDHPDTQRAKRGRVGGLTQRARDVRFVAVDFTRDDLDAKLAAAGHDPALPTTWIWEGVVMYLDAAAIEQTLRTVARRSAERSRLVVMYHVHARILWFVRIVVRLVGEPLKSIHTVDQIRTLLARHGFAVTRDESIPEIAARLSAELAREVPMMRHMRIAAADRVRAP